MIARLFVAGLALATLSSCKEREATAQVKDDEAGAPRLAQGGSITVKGCIAYPPADKPDCGEFDPFLADGCRYLLSVDGAQPHPYIRIYDNLHEYDPFFLKPANRCVELKVKQTAEFRQAYGPGDYVIETIVRTADNPIR